MREDTQKDSLPNQASNRSGLLVTIDDKKIANIILDKPAVFNAFDDELIAEFTKQLLEIHNDPTVRAVCISANGKHFSAGADLKWMKRMAAGSVDDNLQDARKLAELMRVLNGMNKPTLALVQGNAYGGGVGLVACCDIVIAQNASQFCLSEVKLGLIPAVISPYVINAIGERQARRYFMTAETISAPLAQKFGLVHELAETADDMQQCADQILTKIVKNGPNGMAESKLLIEAVANKPISADVIEDTSQRIARLRVSPEGQEGLSAFLEKRRPDWSVQR